LLPGDAVLRKGAVVCAAEEPPARSCLTLRRQCGSAASQPLFQNRLTYWGVADDAADVGCILDPPVRGAPAHRAQFRSGAPSSEFLSLAVPCNVETASARCCNRGLRLASGIKDHVGCARCRCPARAAREITQFLIPSEPQTSRAGRYWPAGCGRVLRCRRR